VVRSVVLDISDKIGINPHRPRPRWLAYALLGILALARAVVVFLVLTAG
jgi:hypothetical protein